MVPAFSATSTEDSNAASYSKDEAQAVGSALFIASITHVGFVKRDERVASDWSLSIASAKAMAAKQIIRAWYCIFGL
jgi:hypothetical protein